jgi:hypothetical protein
VLENRMMKIFELKRAEVTGGFRKLHNEDPSIFGIIKWRRMIWAGQVAHRWKGGFRIRF